MASASASASAERLERLELSVWIEAEREEGEYEDTEVCDEDCSGSMAWPASSIGRMGLPTGYDACPRIRVCVGACACVCPRVCVCD